MNDVIEFTGKAIEAIHKYRNTLQIGDDHYLRVGIRKKNETNKRILIGFDTKNERDKEEEVQGIKIVYAPGEIFFFAGMIIDYVEQEGRKGFVFVEKSKTV